MGCRFRQDGGEPVRLGHVARAVRGIAAAVGDSFFPSLCISCGAPVETGGVFDLCGECSALVLPCDSGGCRVCGSPTPGSCVCGLDGSPAFEAARSAFVWAGPVRGIVLALKYSRRWEMARPMGRVMAAAWRAGCLPAPDVVTCVPLSWRRCIGRGYNQAALLAVEFGRAAGLEVDAGLLRRSGPAGSTRGASRAVRLSRATGSITAAGPDVAEGRRVILVDDVLTTGSTASECARVLRAAGAVRIDVVTFARAVRDI